MLTNFPITRPELDCVLLRIICVSETLPYSIELMCACEARIVNEGMWKSQVASCRDWLLISDLLSCHANPSHLTTTYTELNMFNWLCKQRHYSVYGTIQDTFCCQYLCSLRATLNYSIFSQILK